MLLSILGIITRNFAMMYHISGETIEVAFTKSYRHSVSLADATTTRHTCHQTRRTSMASSLAAKITFALLILSSCASCTSTLAGCMASSDSSLEEVTRNAPAVLTGALQRIDIDAGDEFSFKVFQVFKGDAELRKRKIKLTVAPNLLVAPQMPATTSRDLGTDQTQAPVVAMPLPSGAPVTNTDCLGGATVGQKYIIFARKMGSGKRRYELVFQWVPQSKRALNVVKGAIEEDQMTTQISLSSVGALPGDFTTTATNATEYEAPKTSDAHLDQCPPHYDQIYCLNGAKCNWISGINQPSCECVNNFEGQRCELKILTTAEARLFGQYWEVFVIGTIFAIVILLTLIIAIVYVARKRKQSQATRHQYIQRPTRHIEKNYPVNGTDANQNVSSNKYTSIPTIEPQALVVTNEEETLETVFSISKNGSANSFKLQDPPPGRRTSNPSSNRSANSSRDSSPKMEIIV